MVNNGRNDEIEYLTQKFDEFIEKNYGRFDKSVVGTVARFIYAQKYDLVIDKLKDSFEFDGHNIDYTCIPDDHGCYHPSEYSTDKDKITLHGLIELFEDAKNGDLEL